MKLKEHNSNVDTSSDGSSNAQKSSWKNIQDVCVHVRTHMHQKKYVSEHIPKKKR